MNPLKIFLSLLSMPERHPMENTQCTDQPAPAFTSVAKDFVLKNHPGAFVVLLHQDNKKTQYYVAYNDFQMRTIGRAENGNFQISHYDIEALKKKFISPAHTHSEKEAWEEAAAFICYE